MTTVFYSNSDAKSLEDHFSTTVVFPANFSVGDYAEFVRVAPYSAAASGYYEVSISYTRGNIAAAATHLVAISHANPALWREAGRVNANDYIASGNYCFTIDCNGTNADPRLRVRAVNVLGVTSQDMHVNIKVRAIGFNGSYTGLNVRGNESQLVPLLPMTSEWNLYVGSSFAAAGAKQAIKVLENGFVGIGTGSPTEQLSVKGKIKAQEVKVSMDGWADYVFDPAYQLPDLDSVKLFIDRNRHLPGVPSAAAVVEHGIELGQINKVLLGKIEELTLYLHELKIADRNKEQRIKELESRLNQLETQKNGVKK